MKTGDFTEVTRSFTHRDLHEYALLSGSPVSGNTLPEPLIGSLFSYLLGVRLPGLGTMYLKQQTRYLEPVNVTEPLTARVEVTRLRPDKHLVDLRTICRRADGTLVADGRALVYVRDVVPGED